MLEISLMANGLWVYDHISQRPLAAANRKRMVDKLLARIDAA